MSERDFLWGLSGKELEDAITSGMTKEDISCIEEQARKEEWEKLKALRDNKQISKEEFKNRKNELFSK
jgi:hypothetical protein